MVLNNPCISAANVYVPANVAHQSCPCEMLGQNLRVSGKLQKFPRPTLDSHHHRIAQPAVRMPPKSKKGGDKGRAEDQEVEEPLQAVVCASSSGQHLYLLTCRLGVCRLVRDTVQSPHS